MQLTGLFPERSSYFNRNPNKTTPSCCPALFGSGMGWHIPSYVQQIKKASSSILLSACLGMLLIMLCVCVSKYIRGTKPGMESRWKQTLHQVPRFQLLCCTLLHVGPRIDGGTEWKPPAPLISPKCFKKWNYPAFCITGYFSSVIGLASKKYWTVTVECSSPKYCLQYTYSQSHQSHSELKQEKPSPSDSGRIWPGCGYACPGIPYWPCWP